MTQNQHMKELRRDNPDRSDNKIHFMKDILIHNGHAVDSQFEHNVLPKSECCTLLLGGSISF